MTHPQVAKAIRQRHPKTIIKALQVTIKLESYLLEKTITAVISVLKWGQLKTQIVPSLLSNEQNLVGTIRKLAGGSVALQGMLNYKSSSHICDV